MVRADLLWFSIFRAMSSTGALSWRPIEAKDVLSCAVLLAAIEETDQTGDVFGEEDLLETFRDPGRDYPRGSAGVHDGHVMVGYCCLSSSGSADQVHQMSLYGGCTGLTVSRASAAGCSTGPSLLPCRCTRSAIPGGRCRYRVGARPATPGRAPCTRRVASGPRAGST
jgi:hypothetical protein